MAKVRVGRKEIEEMLKDQLGCTEIQWDKSGNATLEMTLSEIRRERQVYTQQPYYPYSPWPWRIWYSGTDTSTATWSSTPDQNKPMRLLSHGISQTTGEPA